MRAVGIKVLKNRLSEYVRLASQGETVLISDRDRVVAEMVPPQAGRALHADDAAMAELIRHGTLTPALTASRTAPAKPQGRMTLAALLHWLDVDQSDR